MYDTVHISLPKTAEKLFTFLLSFYPETYRRRYGKEMYMLFADMYQEELIGQGKVGKLFWLALLTDALQGIAEQHMAQMRKQGMKNYLQQTLHLNKYNIIGGIFLLPFTTLFVLDIVGRLAQGDFIHYNRAWYAAVTQSVLYREPIVIKIILIYAPFLAVLLNVISFLSAIRIKKRITIRELLLTNPFTVIIIVLGLMFLFIIYGHDFVPCTVHSILRVGLDQLPHILSICRNA